MKETKEGSERRTLCGSEERVKGSSESKTLRGVRKVEKGSESRAVCEAQNTGRGLEHSTVEHLTSEGKGRVRR